MSNSNRPLSPHLSVYRWPITMTLSILHRITGVFLTFGILVLSCWLIALASGAESYAGVASFYGSPWFKLPLVGWAFRKTRLMAESEEAVDEEKQQA